MLLKKIASTIPLRFQQGLKRLYFAHHIKAGKFITKEPEFSQIGQWVSEGDWVIDVGANVGH